MRFLLHLSFLYHFLLIPTLLMAPNRTQSNAITRLGLSSVIERNRTHKKN